MSGFTLVLLGVGIGWLMLLLFHLWISGGLAVVLRRVADCLPQGRPRGQDLAPKLPTPQPAGDAQRALLLQLINALARQHASQGPGGPAGGGQKAAAPPPGTRDDIPNRPGGRGSGAAQPGPTTRGQQP